MTIPIDFIVPISGPNVDILFRMFWGSLVRTCDLSNVVFHIINNGTNSEGAAQVHRCLAGREYYLYRIPRATKIVGPQFTNICLSPEGNPADVAFTCDWAMSNCGVNQWATISHFDVHFKRDQLSRMRACVADDVAIIGHHCPIMLVNRKAYAQSQIKFLSMSSFVACQIPDNSGHYKVRYKDDTRRTADAIAVRGFDTGELLELEMRALRWKVEPLVPWLEEGDQHDWFDHFGGGGSVYDEATLTVHRERALRLIQEHGY